MRTKSKYTSVIFLLCAAFLTACATPAKIVTSEVSDYRSPSYLNKTISFDILYSQPEPKVFGSGAQQAFKPIAIQEKHSFSEKVLEDVTPFIESQLPHGASATVSAHSDLLLSVKLSTPNKLGPVAPDYRLGETFGKKVISLGFAAKNYDLVADYSVELTLFQNGDRIYWKRYDVSSSVKHQVGNFSSPNNLYNYSRDYFRKTLAETLSEFYKAADSVL